MKVQFATRIKDRFGQDVQEIDTDKPLEVGQPPAMKFVSLGGICCAVLDVAFQDEVSEGLKPKLRRAELIEKITEAEKTLAPLEMLDADREMIKERVGKRNYNASITARVVGLLDKAADEPAG